MAITRRQFIQRSGLVAAGSLLGPGLFANPFVRRALADIGNKYLIVIFLDGGNDGLNTVIPASNGTGTLRDDYLNARQTGGGGIRIEVSELTQTAFGQDPASGADLALHPGFRGFAGLPGAPGFFDPALAGKIALIQGCGYPEYSLSHEQSRIIWQTADPAGTGYGGTGWVGRHLALNYNATQIPAVCIDDRIVGEFKQTATSVLAVRRLDNFGFPYDGDYGLDDNEKRTAFLALYDQAIASTNPTVSYVGSGGRITLESSESYPAAGSAYENDVARAPFNQEYEDLGRSTGRDLREIAKVIYGVENGILPASAQARFFQVSNGGYDTHADQGGADPNGQHFSLHAEVAAAVNIFYRDLASMVPGLENRVLVLVWSEFSRRIEQNENGTDHGSQGPMFVIGGTVQGGVYGNHPNIAESAWDNEGNSVYTQDANPFRSTDFRDVYGTVLKHWLGMSQAQIVPAVLQLDAGDPQFYWTTPNFDMGFII